MGRKQTSLKTHNNFQQTHHLFKFEFYETVKGLVMRESTVRHRYWPLYLHPHPHKPSVRYSESLGLKSPFFWTLATCAYHSSSVAAWRDAAPVRADLSMVSNQHCKLDPAFTWCQFLVTNGTGMWEGRRMEGTEIEGPGSEISQLLRKIPFGCCRPYQAALTRR